MPKKRPSNRQRVSEAGKVAEAERELLSTELVQELGPGDASNRLIAPPRVSKMKKKERRVEVKVEVDKKKKQAETKKEREIVMQEVYKDLQRHALSDSEWKRLKEKSAEKKKKKRRMQPSSVSDTDSEEASVKEKNTDDEMLDTCHSIAADQKKNQTDAANDTETKTDCGQASFMDLKSEEESPPSFSSFQHASREESVVDVHDTNETSAAKRQRNEKRDTEMPSTKKAGRRCVLRQDRSVHRVVHVSRTSDIEASRSELPIVGYEQEIMELISLNDVVVVCGQTGCGKTTQVPQFLYEAGYGCNEFPERNGRIGVTQPRRIATTSTAYRVAEELNTPIGPVVGYQIRHENRTTPSTVVKFMTDGILIRELQSDFLLRSYSVLIIDEAHERSLNTDLILGMLSRIVKLRRKLEDCVPLKVIIMSATLEVAAFLSNKRLFPDPPPILNVPSRQFSVTVHFSKKTEVEDYERTALNKVSRIHRQLPPGGILVFLTGRREIDRFCSKLQKRLQPRSHNQSGPESPMDSDADDTEIEDYTSDEEIEVLPGNTDHNPGEETPKSCRNVRVLPLYAMLSPNRQAEVFQPVPAETRLIVVATNVAETSVTIPGIRYVVDAGRANKKVLHPATGISRFDVDWISKASAVQRAGRAGRTLPGHCYRLYSSAHFGQRFDEYELPEIQRVALEDVVLLMKFMNIQKIANFPFPSPPKLTALKAAEATLVAIGALDRNGKVTDLGRQMADFPINPRHSRMILKAKEVEETEHIEGLALHSVSLAAVMSLESPFLVENGKRRNKDQKKIHKPFICSVSDPISTLNALCRYKQQRDPVKFCTEHLLHEKIMKEMSSLDHQLRQAFLASMSVECVQAMEALLPEPSQELVNHLRRCITVGWCDQIARRHTDLQPSKPSKRVPYESQREHEEAVFVHPLSALSKVSPDFVVYVNAMKTSERAYMNLVTRVEPEWIFEAAMPLCTVHSPHEPSRCPFYDDRRDAVCCWHRVRYGSHDWELPLQSVPSEDSAICSSYLALAILSGPFFGKELIPDSDALVMSASYVTTVEARFNKKLGRLLTNLSEHDIFSRQELIRQLESDRSFLHDDLKCWLKPHVWPLFDEKWDKYVRDLCRS